jgi:hypothetical protein
MAFPSPAPKTSTITINVFDGTRQPIAAGDILYTVIDGNQHQVFRDNVKSASFALDNLPYFDNFGDNYTVIAYADGYEQAGFVPVKVAPNAPATIDLMLLNKNAGFNFAGAQWQDIQDKRPALARILSADLASPNDAHDRYQNLLETEPVAACLLNITTAMQAIQFPVGTPLDYVKYLVWNDPNFPLKQDRFYAWADRKIVDQTKLAAQHGEFAPEPGFAFFHSGATSSFKQIQFGEANVQLTFHENNTRSIDGVDCIIIEPDIDYYKDLGAHALLEVIPNGLTGQLTDPRQVYVLRWIAGRHAGVPEFDPLYTIS